MGVAERVDRIKRKEAERAEREAQARRVEQQKEEDKKRFREEKARQAIKEMRLLEHIDDLNRSCLGRKGIFSQEETEYHNGNKRWKFKLEWGENSDLYFNTNVRFNNEDSSVSLTINGVSISKNDESIEEALAQAYVNPSSHEEDEREAARDYEMLTRSYNT